MSDSKHDLVFLYWDDPGDSQDYVDTRHKIKKMTALEFLQNNPMSVEKVVQRLEQAGFKVNYSFGNPCTSTCWANGVEGITVELDYKSYLPEESMEKIKSLFPINTGKVTLEFLSIWDYDYDDDRIWYPSVGFTSDLID